MGLWVTCSVAKTHRSVVWVWVSWVRVQVGPPVDGPLSVTKGDANTKPGANPRKAEAIWRGRAVRFSGRYDVGRTKT